MKTAKKNHSELCMECDTLIPDGEMLLSSGGTMLACPRCGNEWEFVVIPVCEKCERVWDTNELCEDCE